MSNHKKKVKRNQNGRFNVFNIIDREDEDGAKVRVKSGEVEMSKEDVIALVQTYKDHHAEWKKILTKMEEIEAEEAQTEEETTEEV